MSQTKSSTARTRSFRAFALATVSAIALTGCVTTNQPVPVAPVAKAPAPSGPSISLNAGYATGDIHLSKDTAPSLAELINRVPQPQPQAANDEDKLRIPAMRDAGLSYGVQGGLAYASQQINRMLKRRAPDLSKVYDFHRLLIKGPDGVSILPPVISQAQNAWQSSDAGKTIRVADDVYEIIKQARFVPNAPLWHSYLLRTYDLPAAPADELLPKTQAEREAWARFVTQGWKTGIKQAQDIFQADMRRLERDFQGMVRYRALLEQGKVSAPVVADAKLGVTGGGESLRVNDRAVRIAKDPSLNSDDRVWSSSASPVDAEAAATPPAPAHPYDPNVDPSGPWKPYQDSEAPSVPASPVGQVSSAQVPSVKSVASASDMKPVVSPGDKGTPEEVDPDGLAGQLRSMQSAMGAPAHTGPTSITPAASASSEVTTAPYTSNDAATATGDGYRNVRAAASSAPKASVQKTSDTSRDAAPLPSMDAPLQSTEPQNKGSIDDYFAADDAAPAAKNPDYTAVAPVKGSNRSYY